MLEILRMHCNSWLDLGNPNPRNFWFSGHCACKHAAAAVTLAGPICPHCDRTCASDSDLCSHLCSPHCWHPVSTTSLLKLTDYLIQANNTHWF